MFKGLKLRWLFNSLGIVVLIVILAIFGVFISVSNHYYSTARTGLEKHADISTRFFSKYINRSYDEYHMSAYRFAEEFTERGKIEFQFINTRGRIVVSTSGLAAGTLAYTGDVQEAVSTGKTSYWVGNDPVTGERIMSVSGPLMFSDSQVIGVMRYVTSMKKIDSAVMAPMLIAIAVGILIIMFVFFTNLFFIRSIIDPVTEITKTAKKIAAGSYGTLIERKATDEIGELIDSINEMSTEISASERLKADFISSVSHELRTPLTAIAGWGETILSGYIDNPGEIKKGVAIMHKEASRLTKLVEELLDFARMDGGRLSMRMQIINARTELEETLYMYAEKLRGEEIELEYVCDEKIPAIEGDRERLRQVFFNVLDNAARHGGEGKKIKVSVGCDGAFVSIAIRDFGCGIPPDELPHIKYKFYRGSSKARGNGIGLAISDEIIRLHGGTLDILSTVGEGTTVTIKLPVGTAAEPENI